MQREHKAPRVQQVLLEPSVLREYRVLPAQPGPLVPPVYRVPLVISGQRALLGQRARLGLPGQRARLGLLEQPGLRVQLALRVLSV